MTVTNVPKFICVCPAKAIEFNGGELHKVTPASSLNELVKTVVDENTGLPHAGQFTSHVYDQGAIAYTKEECEEMLQVYHDSEQTVVFVGSLSNREKMASEVKTEGVAIKSHMNDAELIGLLFKSNLNEKHKYAFLSVLEGSYSFALYNTTVDSTLAARDASSKHTLFQGVDKKTGGLVITNAILKQGTELSEIPGGSFIFGKFRDRHLHKIPPRTLAREIEHATAEVSTPDKRKSTMNAVSRALAGISAVGLSRSPASTRSTIHSPHSSQPSRGRTPSKSFHSTTPSVKGTADLAGSWRRENSSQPVTPIIMVPCLSGTDEHPSEDIRHLSVELNESEEDNDVLAQAVDDILERCLSPRTKPVEYFVSPRGSFDDLRAVSEIAGSPLKGFSIQAHKKNSRNSTKVNVQKNKNVEDKISTTIANASGKRVTGRGF
eukprot:CAMPEP_0196588060 /NCGR_PEP_ID=MMETSP1081-20130531/59462_1 /TAXON_ID=36882 /ORGANISM="Pyramimonas amylifera, Strain CCMP720" /LENGTH=434 /DNA_ID=CAMNT_0041910447 /DNA_START=72 /DNA_END=1376 /DNA_ORIENTATION=-